MRRITTLIVICIAVFAITAVADAPVVLVDANAPTSGLVVTESTDADRTLDFTLGELRANLVDTPAGAFTRLIADRAGRTGVIGQAALPAFRRTVEVPAGVAVAIEVTNIQTETFALTDADLPTRLAPVRAPERKTPGATTPFSWDRKYYEQTTWTRATWAAVEQTTVMRGRSLATVAVYPVRYRPASGVVEVLTEADVRLRFTGEPVAVDERYASARVDTLIARLTGEPRRDVTPPQGPAGYLIVAAPHLADSPELADLAAWKAATGYDVTIASTADIGAAATDIRDYVKQAYQTWDIPPLYLLLVGDTLDIGYFTGTSSDYPSTDLYFTTTDGEDTIPDLWVGRLPVSFADELAAAATKLVSFEQATWTTDAAWEKRAVFITSRDRYQTTEGTHNSVIADHLDPAGYESVKLYANTYGATGDDIAAALNSGASYVAYSGHGDVTFWVDPYFDEDDIYALTPTVHPVVHSYACLTGRFEHAEAFCDTWIRHERGGVAFWGASAWSFWEEDDLLEKAVFDGFFGASDPADNLTWVSAMSQYGLAKLLEFYGPSDDMLLYYEMYNLFGDPSLDVWTDEPQPIEVTHDGVIDSNAGTIRVTVDGVKGARVGLGADGVCFGTAVTDVEGQAVVPLADLGNKIGSLTLTVTGHNLMPYLADVGIGIGDFALSDFSATGGDRLIDLAWEVTGEAEVRGYHLYRADSEDGTYETLTADEFAAGEGSYGHTDDGLTPQTAYWYKLEAIALDGRSVQYGPITATTDDEQEPADDDDDDDDDDQGCGC